MSVSRKFVERRAEKLFGMADKITEELGNMELSVYNSEEGRRKRDMADKLYAEASALSMALEAE